MGDASCPCKWEPTGTQAEGDRRCEAQSSEITADSQPGEAQGIHQGKAGLRASLCIYTRSMNSFQNNAGGGDCFGRGFKYFILK